MNRALVHQAVTEVLSQIQHRLSGSAREIRDEERVIGAIGRFDSLCGLEATVMLEVRLGVTLSTNVFVNDEGTRALKLAEVVDRIAAVAAGG
jgi:acyl carrier protein